MHTQRQEDGPPTGVLLTCPCCGGVSPERHQSRRFLFTEGRLKNIIQNINNYNSVTLPAPPLLFFKKIGVFGKRRKIELKITETSLTN